MLFNSKHDFTTKYSFIKGGSEKASYFLILTLLTHKPAAEGGNRDEHAPGESLTVWSVLWSRLIYNHIAEVRVIRVGAVICRLMRQ